YADVGAIFAVNLLLAPIDALLTGMTIETIQLADPEQTITIGANLYFAIASTLLLTVVVAFVTERIIEPRLGAYVPPTVEVAPGMAGAPEAPAEEPAIAPEAESLGLRYALYAVIAGIVLVALLTA